MSSAQERFYSLSAISWVRIDVPDRLGWLKERFVGDFVKELFGALDKVTDILNLGRLIFYTASGLPPVLAVAMILRTAGASGQPYWDQFRSDLSHCIDRWPVWFAALIAGFLVANMAYAQTIWNLKSEDDDTNVDTTGYAYRYPQLRTGRLKRSSSEADFDFAAWLISEFYRYVEIAVHIPYGMLLALPLLVVYSIARILLESQSPTRLDACIFAFATWLAVAALGWTVWWRGYWLPKIATRVYRTYVIAEAAIGQGITDYSSEIGASPTAAAAVPAKAEKS
jgi:hypothetical protein